jgi:hypothetical protein
MATAKVLHPGFPGSRGYLRVNERAGRGAGELVARGGGVREDGHNKHLHAHTTSCLCFGYRL